MLHILSIVAVLATGVAPQSPCSPSPCGINTVCDVNGAGSAVCRCQAGFDHAPGSNTIEGCPNRISANAPRRQAQRPSRPRPQIPRGPSGPDDPCFPSPCGTNADCRSTGNRAVCSCPAGYEGDPYTGCTADPCSVNPCGANARCERSGETNSPRMQNIPGDLFDNFLTQRLHPSLDIQNAVPGCLMILCFFFYPATA